MLNKIFLIFSMYAKGYETTCSLQMQMVKKMCLYQQWCSLWQVLPPLYGKRNYHRLPNADKMAADQKTSPNKAGMKRSPPIRSPYLRWNGSNIVT